jgi:drug/metabolite transporter (DMT)-like permease
MSSPISSSRQALPQTNNVLGAGYVVLCCMLLAGTTLLARAMGPQIAGEDALHPILIAWARFAFGAAILVPIAVLRRTDLSGTPWRLYLGRVCCGIGGVTGMFAAAGLMPLADATAISFLSPLFAMVFAIIFLGERVGPWRWGAAALAFAGAMVLTRPGSAAFEPAALIALTAAAFMGAELIFIKYLSGREGHVKILAVNNALAAALMTIPAILVWQMPSGEQWLMLMALSAAMVGAQVLFLRGISIAEANVAAPFFYTMLIFAALYGWILFGEVPGPVTLAGAALILLGAGILTWRENRARRPVVPPPPEPR